MVPVVAFGLVEAAVGLVDAGYVFCVVVGAAVLAWGDTVRRLVRSPEHPAAQI